jgi:hypothetical protein
VQLPNWNRINEAFYGLVRGSRDQIFVTVP